MNKFESTKSELRNSISDSVKDNAAFNILWDSWEENSDYSVVDAIINSIAYISVEESLLTVELMIKKAIFHEQLLGKLNSMIKQLPYAIGKGNNDIAKFKQFAIDIIKMHYKYSFNALCMFADLLEYLFAYGYTDLADCITYLYAVLPLENTADAKYHIRRKLVRVYSYNSMNYAELKGILDEAYEYCKASKQKFMYGNIYYYHAVLEVLSKGQYSYDLQEYLEKACKYRCDLAPILKLHINKN